MSRLTCSSWPRCTRSTCHLWGLRITVRPPGPSSFNRSSWWTWSADSGEWRCKKWSPKWRWRWRWGWCFSNWSMCRMFRVRLVLWILIQSMAETAKACLSYVMWVVCSNWKLNPFKIYQHRPPIVNSASNGLGSSTGFWREIVWNGNLSSQSTYVSCWLLFS